MEESRHSSLHDTVSALAWSLASAAADDNAPALAGPYNDVTQFILRQHARMSDNLRGPLGALTHGFDWFTALRTGRRFRHLPPEIRARLLAAWRGSGLALQRDFVRFYDSLATLAVHSRPLAPVAPTASQHANALRDPPRALLCEVVVIGSGPGGSITAALLAEAGRDVLVLEEGPFLPLESCTPFSLQEMEQKYRNGGLTVALGRTKIAYVEGRCVGGGSEINSGLYHRTPPDILEAWRRDFTVDALTERDLQPHFEANERDLSVSNLTGDTPAASLKLHQGASRLGWNSLEVPRWFARGRRQSMTQTFVPRLLAAGGRLVPDTRVHTLRREGAQWQLAARHARLGALRISADTVIVCAGAVHTPTLLRRSGIKRHIGNALRLHPTVKLVARFPEDVNAADMGVPVHQVKEFAPRLSFGCSISSPPFLALGLLDHPAVARAVPQTWRQLASYYAMITGEGSGTVRTVPGCADPVVRYRLTTADRRDLGDGLQKLAEAMFAAGASAVYPGLPNGVVWHDAAAAKSFAAEFPAAAAGLMTIHLFSSCPMGERLDRCATDSFGRVIGVPNLRIADASLLCGAPGVNPQGTIMALARRNALQFLGKL